MREKRFLMGMPITVELADNYSRESSIDDVYEYFKYIDNKFSVYKEESEISLINQKKIREENYSKDMQIVLALSEETKKLTDGYFDIITPLGKRDPSGLVKGWAIFNAAQLLKKQGYLNFYIEAGGDIQTYGKNSEGRMWSVGIRNPFEPVKNEIIKVVAGENLALATSGTYLRGQHIWNPKEKDAVLEKIVSLTVIGPNVYEADRFATAAFAMGRSGIFFIESLEGFEGYAVDSEGVATETSGFKQYAIG